MGKILLYGAGRNGYNCVEKAKALGLESNIYGFIDSDMKKVGLKCNGKEVYSLSQAKELIDTDTLIMITIDYPGSLSVMGDLLENEICQFVAIDYLDGDYENTLKEVINKNGMELFIFSQSQNYSLFSAILKQKENQIRYLLKTIDPAKMKQAGGELRQRQLEMVQLASKIHTLAKDKGLHLIIWGGNLIGCVRHNGGFIPWDDDLDFLLLDDEYELLVDCLSEEMPFYRYYEFKVDGLWWDGYWDRYYSFCEENAKKSQEGIILVEDVHCLRVYKYTEGRKHGVVIDIETFTRYGASYSFEKRESRALKFRDAFYNSQIKDLRALIRKEMDEDKRYQSKDGEKVFFSPRVSIYHTRLASINDFWKSSDLYPLKLEQFEGKEFYVPNDIDSFLLNLYGDYMKLPSNAGLYNHDI